MESGINGPTPGTPKPASSDGTRNNAEVFRYPNYFTSCLTTDLTNGNPLVVNLTDPGSLFVDGYAARTVSNGYVLPMEKEPIGSRLQRLVRGYHLLGIQMIFFGENICVSVLKSVNAENS